MGPGDSFPAGWQQYSTPGRKKQGGFVQNREEKILFPETENAPDFGVFQNPGRWFFSSVQKRRAGPALLDFLPGGHGGDGPLPGGGQAAGGVCKIHHLPKGLLVKPAQFPRGEMRQLQQHAAHKGVSRPGGVNRWHVVGSHAPHCLPGSEKGPLGPQGHQHQAGPHAQKPF